MKKKKAKEKKRKSAKKEKKHKKEKKGKKAKEAGKRSKSAPVQTACGASTSPSFLEDAHGDGPSHKHKKARLPFRPRSRYTP